MIILARRANQILRELRGTVWFIEGSDPNTPFIDTEGWLGIYVFVFTGSPFGSRFIGTFYTFFWWTDTDFSVSKELVYLHLCGGGNRTLFFDLERTCEKNPLRLSCSHQGLSPILSLLSAQPSRTDLTFRE